MNLRRKRMDILTNKNAGGNIGRSGKIARLKKAIGYFGKVHAPPNIEAVRACVEEAKRAGVAFLGIDGGDGTIHRTVTELVRVYGQNEQYPKVIFLPCGTMNTVRASLQTMEGPWEKILERVSFKLHNNIPFVTGRVRVLDINGENGFIFGTGLVVRLLHEYYQSAPQGKRGPLHAALTVARIIGSSLIGGELGRRVMTRDIADIWTPAAKEVDDYTAILASTITQIGLGCSPLKRVSERPDRFMLLATKLRLSEMVLNIFKIWKGRPLPRSFEDFPLMAQFDFLRPTPYVIDGDIKRPVERVVIRLGPEIEYIKE